MKKACSLLSLIVIVAWGDPAVAGKRAVLGPAAVVQFQVPDAEGPRFEPRPEPVYPPAPAPDAANPGSVPVPSGVAPPGDAGPTFEPQPEPISPPARAPDTINPGPVPVPSEAGPSIELYSRVRYKDLDEKHPKAVPTVVSVPNPATGWKRNYFSPPPMVHVTICVPPNCGPPKVKYKSLFREYEFDFGKYAVDVRLRDGGIEVDYQD